MATELDLDALVQLADAERWRGNKTGGEYEQIRADYHNATRPTFIYELIARIKEQEARAAAPVVPAGYALVPVEPTDEMRLGAWIAWMTCEEPDQDEKMQAALREAIAAAPQPPAQIAASPAMVASAVTRYTQAMEGCEEKSALERLRFFCSIAMSGQDWLDVEPFFEAVAASSDEDRRDAERWRYIAPRYTGFDFDWMPSSEDARDGKTVAVFNMGPEFRFSVDIAGDIDEAMQKGGSDE